MNILEAILGNCVKYPEKTAVSFQLDSITFKELHEQILSIASFISKQGLRNECIAIETDNLIQHVAAMMGVLASGNYYLSVTEDNAWYINENFPIQIAAKLSNSPAVHQDYPIFNFSDISPASDFTPQIRHDDENVYALITSGTKGKPKVVIHSFKNINEDIFRQICDNNITSADKVDLLFSLTFSASVSCVYTALCSGAELCIYSIRQQGIAGLLPFWERKQITYSTISVSVFTAFCKLNSDFKHLSSIRLLGLGTEPVTQTAIDYFKSHFPSNTQLKIAYSSTEGRTMAQGIFDNNEYLKYTGTVGKPVEGKSIEIVDINNQPVNAGAHGKIVVKSAFIATEYAGNPIEYSSTFNNIGNETTYITGDEGYFDKEGNLYVKGRVNGAVKINGIAIDLNLIEDILTKNPAILKVAVVANATRKGVRQIVAFIEAAEKNVDTSVINSYLQGKLPASHYPSYFCILEALPLSHSGKIDRYALEHCEFEAISNRLVSVGESDSVLVNIIVGIFNITLETENATAHTSFFTDLGGDSLKSMVALAAIEQQLGIKLPVYSIWTHHTPSSLALYLRENVGNKKIVTHKVNEFNPKRKTLFLINRFADNNDYKHIADSVLSNTFNIVHLLNHLDDVKDISDIEAIIQQMADEITLLSSTGGAYLLGFSFQGFLAHQVATSCNAVKACIMLDTYNYFELESYARKRSKIETLINVSRTAISAGDFELLFRFLKSRLLPLKDEKQKINKEATLEKKSNLWQSYYHAAREKGNDRISCDCIFFRATRTLSSHGTHGRNWKINTKGKFSYFNIHCKHIEIISKENSAKIVAILSKLID